MTLFSPSITPGKATILRCFLRHSSPLARSAPGPAGGGDQEEVPLMSHAEVRDRLLREDSGFQRLVKKHEEYDRRLQSLQSRKFLSDDEKLEEVTLKKRKLMLKDEMEAMVLNSAAR